MARPELKHDGFLVPNAAWPGLNPRMAEPDQIDFNTVAHARWGVIEDCEVTCSGTMAMTNGGIALVDGNLVRVSAQSQPIGVGGAQDRFDLIAVDAGGILTVIKGDPAVDPVFPDPALDRTALAAIYAPAGETTNFASNVIDKRKFIQKALLTKIPPASMLVQNLNGTGDEFSLTGEGHFTWKTDTELWRSDTATLRIKSKLRVDDSITANGLVQGGTVQALGTTTGANLAYGPDFPASADPGSLYQRTTDGRLYIRRGGAWKELATIESASPVGSILTSVEPPSVMVPLGWLPLDGRTISEADYDQVFDLVSLQGYITGAPGSRSMTLPDATNRVLLTRWGANAGAAGGPTNNQISLQTAQLPRHKHDVTVQMGGGSAMSATVSRAGLHGHALSGGAHGHPVNDPGHAHHGFDFFGNMTPVIGLMWGGRNKIDALFNDRNHTYSVEAFDWITPAYTGISVSSAGSEHGHFVQQDGDHDHVVNVSAVPPHNHSCTETEVGVGAPVDITPSYLVVYTYLRS